jgi:hypothetical protein
MVELEHTPLNLNLFGYALRAIFMVVSVGVAYNYNELYRLKNSIEEL